MICTRFRCSARQPLIAISLPIIDLKGKYSNSSTLGWQTGTSDACNMNRLAAIFCRKLRILRGWCEEVPKQMRVGAVDVLVPGMLDPVNAGMSSVRSSVDKICICS